MRILIFHGYLLGGTGSNVYNARLAAALVRAGHEVHLLCQDREPFAQAWVDAAGNWDGGALAVETRREPVRATVYRPDLGGLLPVYVADRYEGIEAKPFSELSDAELDGYLERNVAAVREVAERARPDVALANHLVMGPCVLARALEGVPYAVKVHGSALEYTVKPNPARFLPYAREGLAPAQAVLVGSRHTAESLWAAMDDPDLEARTKLGPPGVDVEEFQPREAKAARGRRAWRAARGRGCAAAAARQPPAPGSSFARDEGAAAAALGTIARRRPPRRLRRQADRLQGRRPAARRLAARARAGAGGEARGRRLRRLPGGAGAARRRPRRRRSRRCAAHPRRERAGARRTCGAFLDDAPEGYGGGADRIVWAGRLDHAELADLLPATEAMVVPSTFPEAFGMVAAEAAACGSLPVVARHSGLGEVATTLSEVVPEAARPLLSFERGPNAIPELAAAVAGWLEAPDDLRAATREAMVAITRERYSWEGVARTVIAAAEGDVAGLPAP